MEEIQNVYLYSVMHHTNRHIVNLLTSIQYFNQDKNEHKFLDLVFCIIITHQCHPWTLILIQSLRPCFCIKAPSNPAEMKSSKVKEGQNLHFRMCRASFQEIERFSVVPRMPLQKLIFVRFLLSKC